MPLDEVMAQYSKGEVMTPMPRRLLGADKLPGSPYLRARRTPQESASTSSAGPSCSSSSSIPFGKYFYNFLTLRTGGTKSR